ncbi:hypothetical protein [Algibacter sp. L4_22]|uniref:hypothetical protein n=1 Tax=Algibacter sp. L4_22 TaxID=2942477 RepID=UPI00201B48C0|nr:hypothetical protein [Algibacter sp. L4_22]MCL5129114.1 hypothetical protein [Algibacter sp. L4_22]
MKNLNYSIVLLFFVLFQMNSYSQVGIGTTDPHISSVLEMESTTQGVLTPRMTTLQRVAIATPADGLLVFDIDESVFYFYNGTSWVPLEGAEKRDNYKLVKSVADLADELAAGGGAEYLLTTDFMYEINGQITLAAPINLNGAYLIGEDTNEDILVNSAGGTIFEGSTGGSIRGLTLTAPGGTVFNLSGSSGTERFVFRDCVVANSTSVGTISSYGLVFVSIVQYVNNSAGITFDDIHQLLLNSEGWASDNTGVYQSFTGDFDIIAKQGGFSKVVGATAAIDITGVSSLTSGNISNVNFYGGGNYINGTSPYIGYNFPKEWDVNSPGIPVETDGVATGDINFSANVGSGTSIAFTGTGIGSRKKISGTTVSNSLFRFAKDGSNKITYEGKKARYFGITASLSFQGDSSNTIFIFYLAKNGNVIDQTKVYRENGANNDVGAAAVVGTVELSEGDYVEVWAERYSGTGGLILVSLNLIAR